MMTLSTRVWEQTLTEGEATVRGMTIVLKAPAHDRSSFFTPL